VPLFLSFVSGNALQGLLDKSFPNCDNRVKEKRHMPICSDPVRRYFPDIPDDKYSDFLFQTTAFPFDTAENIAEQVKEMAEKSGGDWQRAMAIADEEMDAALDSEAV